MDVGQHSQGRKQSSGLHGFIGSQFSLLGTQLHKHKHGTFISLNQATKTTTTKPFSPKQVGVG
jgi:hypothetical protein